MNEYGGPDRPERIIIEDEHINRVTSAVSKGFANATLHFMSGTTDILLRLVRGLVDIALKGVNEARKAVGSAVTIIVLAVVIGYLLLVAAEKAWEGVVWYTRDDTQQTIQRLIGVAHSNSDQINRRVTDPEVNERLQRAPVPAPQPPQ